jgi:serine/threonine-protein kinase
VIEHAIERAAGARREGRQPSETRLKGLVEAGNLAHDPMMGRTIAGRYVVRDCLGAGSMGTVYRAQQLPMRREVAFKILHRDHAVNAESKARFLREAQATSSLFSEHTVTVYDFGESESGELFLAMEALDGESLGARLKRVGAFRPSEAVSVALQVLSSLTEAHQKGIIHRDLKPDNLFFARSRDGSNREVVKVLDFGIAKVLHDEQQRLSPIETAAGTVFGTPRYMSPEQAQGRQLDARSDLYSLGVMLYHMLTGHAPFTDDDAIVVMAHHIKTRPATPSALGVSLSDALERVLMQALAKRPCDRPATASVFTTLLLDAASDPDAPLSGATTHAHPPSFPPVTSTGEVMAWTKRPTVLATAGIALLMGTVIAGARLLFPSKPSAPPSVEGAREGASEAVAQPAPVVKPVDPLPSESGAGQLAAQPPVHKPSRPVRQPRGVHAAKPPGIQPNAPLQGDAIKPPPPAPVSNPKKTTYERFE